MKTFPMKFVGCKGLINGFDLGTYGGLHLLLVGYCVIGWGMCCW